MSEALPLSGNEATKPTVPVEVLKIIMECVGERSWKKTLLTLMGSCRAAYELGLEPLMRDLDWTKGYKWKGNLAKAPRVDLFGNGRLELVHHLKIKHSPDWQEGLYGLFDVILSKLESLDIGWGPQHGSSITLVSADLRPATALKKLTLGIDSMLTDLVRTHVFLPPSLEHLVLTSNTRLMLPRGFEFDNAFEIIVKTGRGRGRGSRHKDLYEALNTYVTTMGLQPVKKVIKGGKEGWDTNLKERFKREFGDKVEENNRINRRG
jgi:hypothetical protein